MNVLWDRHLEREIRRYRDGRARMPYDARKRERQLIRIGSAAWGAGLSALMLGDARHARLPRQRLPRTAQTRRGVRARAQVARAAVRRGRRLGLRPRVED